MIITPKEKELLQRALVELMNEDPSLSIEDRNIVYNLLIKITKESR